MSLKTETLDKLPSGNDELRRAVRAHWIMFWSCIVLVIGNIVLVVTALESFRNERALSAEIAKLHHAKGNR